VRDEPFRDLDPKRRRLVVHVERPPQSRCALGLSGGVPGGDHRRTDRVGVRVPALTEQCLHLLGRHVRSGVDPGQAGEPGTDPHPGGLALLRVVVAQAGVALVGRVRRRDLPGQVGVPVPGGELVQRHHTPVSAAPSLSWTAGDWWDGGFHRGEFGYGHRLINGARESQTRKA
jgi:hypothetical protein